MSNHGIIFNIGYRTTEYYKGQPGNLKSTTLKEAFEYYDDPEKCETAVSNENSIEMEDAFNYYDYRLGSSGGFSRNGRVKKHSDIEKSYKKYQPEILYRCVFSFTDEFALENDIKSNDKMQLLFRKSMNRNLKAMGFDPDNIEWFGFYHTNTAHPHVHIAFFEKDKTKRRFMIQKEKFPTVKSNVISTMQVNIDMYIQRDIMKSNLYEQFKRLNYPTSVIDMLLHSENNACSFWRKNRKLRNKFKKLNDILPKTGSMKYNSANIMPYRSMVMDFVQDMLKEEPINQLYSKLKESLEKEADVQENIYGLDTQQKEKYVKDRLETVEIRLANMVLQNVKCYREDFNKEHIKEIPNNKLKDSQSKRNKFLLKKQRLHTNRRLDLMRYGTVRQMDAAIQKAFYSSMSQQRQVDQVVRNAQLKAYLENQMER